MNRFGTISKCPTCDKNVYAAEQAIGPGRRMYHKFCLKCSSCAKVLTPGSFREHDFEPFCQTCHLREFSTQDLRFANVLPPSPTRRARLSPVSTPPPPIRVTRLVESGDAIYEEDEEELELRSSPVDDRRDLDYAESQEQQTNDLRETEDGDVDADEKKHDRFLGNGSSSRSFLKDTGDDDNEHWDGDGDDRFSMGRSPSPTKPSALSSPSFMSSARLTTMQSPFRTYSARTGSIRPISPDATGMSTASAPLRYISTNMTGSSVQPVRQAYTGAAIASKGTTGRRHTYTPPGFSGTPSCPRCDKPVYFAEQVKSCGKSWHKLCLRCSECSTLLDPARVSDRDGVVLCRSCYSKLHGPVGRGYGLIGKIS